MNPRVASGADTDRYDLHGPLTLEELQVGDMPIVELLRSAEEKLRAFAHPIDAIV